MFLPISLVPAAITHSSSRGWIYLQFTVFPALAELVLLHPHKDINTSHHHPLPKGPSSVVPLLQAQRFQYQLSSVPFSETEFELHGANPPNFWEFVMNCVYVPPQKPLCWSPNPQYDGIWRYSLWEMSLLFSPLLSPLLPPLPPSLSIRPEDSCPQARKQVFTRLQLCHTLIFNFSASRSVRNKCSLFKLPSLWYFCNSSPKWTKRCESFKHLLLVPSVLEVVAASCSC